MGDKIKLIGGVFGLIAAIVSGYLFTENWMRTVASSAVDPVDAKVEALSKRVTLSELKAMLRDAQKELLFWKQQKRKYPNDPDIQEEYDAAKDRVNELKEEIKEMEKKERES